MSKSAMVQHFSYVPQSNIKRSVFQGPKRHLTTFDADYLIPFYVEEVLPSDTFHVSTNIFARTASLKKPIMDNVKLDTFYFYVPNRLLWDNWAAMIGEQEDPMDPVEFEVPSIMSGPVGFRTRSLEDYFGAQVGQNSSVMISLYHRAYYMIFNEWFRDENLIDKLYECKGDSDVDDSSNKVEYTLQKRGKRHDYFTSCLPWPQKGEAVQVPIGGEAPVFGNGKSLGLMGDHQSYPSLFGLYKGQAPYTGNFASEQVNVPVGTVNMFSDTHADNYTAVGVASKEMLENHSFPHSATGLYADLSEATAYDVNTLRTAIQLQVMKELDARGGTRYTEIMRVHYGAVSPDARLQRPEYLGGSNSSMNVYPITQTSASQANSPQANLSAMALITNKSGFSKSFTEFGVILGIMCVTADLNYQQGMPRKFRRKNKYDYAWPALAHIGEQAVLNGELFYQGGAVQAPDGTPVDDEVFGYQERYAEYRYNMNMITGDLRSNVTTPESSGSLDLWHLAQDFEDLPVLGEAFMESDTPMDRVLAVPGTEQNPIPDFIADIYMDLRYVRPLPTYGTPGLMDHF